MTPARTSPGFAFTPGAPGVGVAGAARAPAALARVAAVDRQLAGRWHITTAGDSRDTVPRLCMINVHCRPYVSTDSGGAREPHRRPAD